MSESYDRGRNFERRVQKLTSKMLGIESKRDSRSGAGLHKQDIRDRFNLLPLSIECKDQEKLSVKKEWRITDQKAIAGQAACVTFPDNEEILCVLRYSDLLNFIKEAADWKESYEAERIATVAFEPEHNRLSITRVKGVPNVVLKSIVAKKAATGAKFDKNGHIADSYGYCNQKGCKYSRGYRPPKVKK